MPVGAYVRKEDPGDGSSVPVVKADVSGGEIVKKPIKPRVGRMAPTSATFEVEKFDGSGNVALWQTRVKDLLGQQGS